METRKLYYEDAFLRSFEATVLSCEESKGGFAVVLDATAFYPEGGGQPCDFGVLGGAAVKDVREKGGIITHTCDKPLAVGDTVHGEIDWARRFDHMQQHSGEHIVSGMLCSAYHCDNVGFHMGADKVVIDYNADIPWEGVLGIEAKANQYLWENHPFCETWYEGAALEAVEYRSKKPLEGAVRITEFPDADRCACCGTHVQSAGQVGLIKVLSNQKFRSGSRIEIIAGKRAFDYLTHLHLQNTVISQILSAKPLETADAVIRMKNELAAEKLRAATLEEQLNSFRATEYEGKGDVLLIEEEMNSESLRRLAVAIGERCGGRCAVFAGNDGNYKYAVRLAAGGDERAFAKEMNGALHGRGGGRDGFIQGSCTASENEIRAFFGA